MSTEAFLISLPTSQAQRIHKDVSVVRNLVTEMAQDSERRLSLDEAWAPLHFTLTGEYPIPRQKAAALGLSWNEYSLENAIMGGDATPFLGAYGPARYLPPALVSSLADQLATIDPVDFRSRVDPQALIQERMLPDGWGLETAPDLLHEKFQRLKAFYSNAKTRGEGVLIYFA